MPIDRRSGRPAPVVTPHQGVAAGAPAHVEGSGGAGRARPERTPAGGSDVLLDASGMYRYYESVRAVDGVDLSVREGEVFALLGPSGSGKTTCLRMVAGLEPLDRGRIVMGGRVLADASAGRALPAERRNIAMVFQSYAIWPHMTVAGNVGFPLRMRGVRRARRRELVREILEITGMGELVDRRASQLSGGQQQRVALARALVYRPQLLLLDEPLSNLDTKLRVQMRQELRRLNRELKVSMLFVTHDQDEAFSLADRIAVMSDGRIQQVGTPAELYERPETPFVRDFLGRCVIVNGRVERSEGATRIRLDDPSLGPTPFDIAQDLSTLPDQAPVAVHARPEDVVMTEPADGAEPGPNQVRTTVLATTYLGDRVEYVADVGGHAAVLLGSRQDAVGAGAEVFLSMDPHVLTVWPR